jgi:hyperosmotically inducible protein
VLGTIPNGVICIFPRRILMKFISIAFVAFVAACSKDKPADYPPMAATTTPETSAPSAAAVPNSSHETTAATGAASTPTPAAAHDSAANMPATPGAGGTSPVSAQGATAPSTGAGPRQPDNTAVNERDRSSSALTPMDQGNSESDRKMTQQIRKSVMGDKSLSFTAKNVKIITKNGMVTLRGPVKSDAEKASIDASARQAAGDHIDNQLEVKK